MKLSAAIGGFAGACALTLMDQAISKIDRDAPRLDLLGMNAVAKIFPGHKGAPEIAQRLLPTSVAGDLVSNSLYYALATGRDKKTTLLKGALLGFGAGLGALLLPKYLGLPDASTNHSTRTQLMTVFYYVVGGLVAATTMNVIEKNGTSFDLEQSREPVTSYNS